MILHTINKPSAWQKCDGLVRDSDEVLLLEDGVFLALEKDLECVAIAADIEARGLKGRLGSNVRLINFEEFVRLAVAAEKVCAWF